MGAGAKQKSKKESEVEKGKKQNAFRVNDYERD